MGGDALSLLRRGAGGGGCRRCGEHVDEEFVVNVVTCLDCLSLDLLGWAEDESSPEKRRLLPRL